MKSDKFHALRLQQLNFCHLNFYICDHIVPFFIICCCNMVHAVSPKHIYMHCCKLNFSISYYNFFKNLCHLARYSQKHRVFFIHDVLHGAQGFSSQEAINSRISAIITTCILLEGQLCSCP